MGNIFAAPGPRNQGMHDLHSNDLTLTIPTCLTGQKPYKFLLLPSQVKVDNRDMNTAITKWNQIWDEGRSSIKEVQQLNLSQEDMASIQEAAQLGLFQAMHLLINIKLAGTLNENAISEISKQFYYAKEKHASAGYLLAAWCHLKIGEYYQSLDNTEGKVGTHYHEALKHLYIAEKVDEQVDNNIWINAFAKKNGLMLITGKENWAATKGFFETEISNTGSIDIKEINYTQYDSNVSTVLANYAGPSATHSNSYSR